MISIYFFSTLILFSPSVQSQKNYLRFNEASDKFKIAQFTDLHFGEGEDVEWGPEQDKMSLSVMNEILDLEQPDLVVFTGDMLTGNNIADNATDYWRIMLDPLIRRNLSWAVVFGNHDDLASGIDGSRLDLLQFDISFPGSRSQIGPKQIHGVSNYYIPIFPAPNNNNNNNDFSLAYPRFVLYFFDSNNSGVNGTGWGCVMQDQVDWYNSVSIGMRARFGRTIPSMAFFHIPTTEFSFVWAKGISYGTNNDSVACCSTDMGLISSFLRNGDVRDVFVGHNHGNDYCGYYDNNSNSTVRLCYGRHTGYGGYGTWDRGARVIEINEDDASVNTWIRFEGGRVEQKGQLHLPSGDEPTCSGSWA